VRHALVMETYVFCDATYVQAQVRGPVVSQEIMVAIGVRTDGDREVLGCEVGDSEDGTFWTAFLRELRERGLGDVRFVISQHPLSLRFAAENVFIGATWQRCRVHFLRNALARVPKGRTQMVAAAIRTIFAQSDAAHVETQLDVVADTLGFGFPEVAKMVAGAKDDLRAFREFPIAHWPKIWSTNPWNA